MLDLLLNHSPAFVGGELLLALSLGMFGFALIGAVREWGEFEGGNAMTYLYVGGLAAQALALAVLYRRMT